MTNARLDHYVYTCESLERARETAPTTDGVMVLTFMVQEAVHCRPHGQHARGGVWP